MASQPDRRGTAAARPTLPYGRQQIDQDDIDAVVAVLQGDWLTQGPAVERFEQALCETTGASHAVAFSSGTAALHAAVATAGIGPGHRVGVPSLTFTATAACAHHVGATPQLLDISSRTWSLDPRSCPADLDALIAVHYAGRPIELGALTSRPPIVIEDACHALGASTPDGPVGNCARSDMACFSFHPVKPITTGEGGAVTTNSLRLAEGLRRFRNHNIIRRPDIDPWHYEVATPGFNHRLSDIHAALGTSQLTKLPAMVRRRQEIADRYRSAFADLAVRMPDPPSPGFTHANHLFPIHVSNRRSVYEELHTAGIRVQVHYVPLHRHPAYAHLGIESTDVPVTEDVYAGLLSIPIYPSLSDRDVDHVIEAVARSVG